MCSHPSPPPNLPHTPLSPTVFHTMKYHAGPSNKHQHRPASRQPATPTGLWAPGQPTCPHPSPVDMLPPSPPLPITSKSHRQVSQVWSARDSSCSLAINGLGSTRERQTAPSSQGIPSLKHSPSHPPWFLLPPHVNWDCERHTRARPRQPEACCRLQELPAGVREVCPNFV